MQVLVGQINELHFSFDEIIITKGMFSMLRKHSCTTFQHFDVGITRPPQLEISNMPLITSF